MRSPDRATRRAWRGVGHRATRTPRPEARGWGCEAPVVAAPVFRREDGGPDRIRTGDLQRDRLACWAATPRVRDRWRIIAGTPGCRHRARADDRDHPFGMANPVRRATYTPRGLGRRGPSRSGSQPRRVRDPLRDSRSPPPGGGPAGRPSGTGCSLSARRRSRGASSPPASAASRSASRSRPGPRSCRSPSARSSPTPSCPSPTGWTGSCPASSPRSSRR